MRHILIVRDDLARLGADSFHQQDKVAKRLGSELCEAAYSGDLATILEVLIAHSRRATS